MHSCVYTYTHTFIYTYIQSQHTKQSHTLVSNATFIADLESELASFREIVKTKNMYVEQLQAEADTTKEAMVNVTREMEEEKNARATEQKALHELTLEIKIKEQVSLSPCPSVLPSPGSICLLFVGVPPSFPPCLPPSHSPFLSPEGEREGGQEGLGREQGREEGQEREGGQEGERARMIEGEREGG